MSYLELPGGIPDFAKAVISFWFRVPQESMDAAQAAYNISTDPLSLSNGIIPLVVMGERGTGQTPSEQRDIQMIKYNIYGNYIAGSPYSLNGKVTTEVIEGGVLEITRTQNLNCYWAPLPAPYAPVISYQTVPQLVATGPAPQTDPSYIGVDGAGRLYINFQTGKTPQVSGRAWNLDITPGTETNAISDYGGFPLGELTGDPYDSSAAYFVQGQKIIRQFGIYGPIGVVIVDDFHHVSAPGGHNIIKPIEHWEDISGLVMDTTGVITNDGVQSVTADHWHHMLISTDLQTIQTHGIANPDDSYEGPIANYVDSAARLFVALDDVNYTQYDLSSWWVEGADDNDVITDDAMSIAGSHPTTDDEGASLGRTEFTLLDPAVPSSAKPLGLPGTPEFVENIYPVEMAEFQMWVGVTLDTGDEANRRHFVDADGVPVPPEQNEQLDEEGNVIKSAGSIALLGRPDILLHGSSNWSAGKNAGPMIDNPDYNPDLPEGPNNPVLISDPTKQFTPTGQIVSYIPDPSLHGPQSPPEEAEPPPLVRLSRHPRPAPGQARMAVV